MIQVFRQIIPMICFFVLSLEYLRMAIKVKCRYAYIPSIGFFLLLLIEVSDKFFCLNIPIILHIFTLLASVGGMFLCRLYLSKKIKDNDNDLDQHNKIPQTETEGASITDKNEPSQGNDEIAPKQPEK